MRLSRRPLAALWSGHRRMTGKIAIIVIALCALGGGAAMYYLQVYGYYRTLNEQTVYAIGRGEDRDVLAINGFRGIDSDSSPLRYRACFNIEGALPTLAAYPGAEPLNAPGWFECFNAATLGADLISGAATAGLIEADAPWGFDRVMALYPDGRAYVWPQINRCGEAHFDGRRLPAGCVLPERNP